MNDEVKRAHRERDEAYARWNVTVVQFKKAEAKAERAEAEVKRLQDLLTRARARFLDDTRPCANDTCPCCAAAYDLLRWISPRETL